MWCNAEADMAEVKRTSVAHDLGSQTFKNTGLQKQGKHTSDPHVQAGSREAPATYTPPKRAKLRRIAARKDAALMMPLDLLLGI